MNPTDLSHAIHAPDKIERQRIISAFSTADNRLLKRADRLQDCCSHGRLYLDGSPPTVRLWVHRCGDRLCPLCSRYRAREISDQLLRVMVASSDMRHITLTLRSDPTDSLADLLSHLRQSFARLRRNPAWKRAVVGGAYVVEITRNAETGAWHPHLHVLADGNYIAKRELSDIWRTASGGSDVCWISAARSKHVKYLAKYAGKPASLTGWPAQAIAEYAIATHGVRMVQTFGSMHRLPLRDDDTHPEPPKVRHTIGLAALRAAAVAGDYGALAMVRAVVARWPRLWRYYNQQVDLPPPRTAADGQVDIELLQDSVDHSSQYIIHCCNPIKAV